MLNKGPEGYQKLVFSCFSISNPGLICEHDIFTILEEFKQGSSFEFYNRLMKNKDIRRDYQTMTDKSDQTFFDVFLNDLKKVSNIYTLHKRMMGINKADSHIERDI